MSRLKLFILLGFVIMFVAGLEVGRAHTSIASLKSDWAQLVSTLTGKNTPTPTTQPTKPETDAPHVRFGDIELTAAQDEQVHRIFHDARARADVIGKQFHEIDDWRIDGIISILDPVQKMEYDAIEEEHDARVAEMRSKIGAIMEKASSDVRAILTPDQQKQYDADKKKFAENMDHGHRGSGNGPRRGGPPGPSTRWPHQPSPETGPSAHPSASGPTQGQP